MDDKQRTKYIEAYNDMLSLAGISFNVQTIAKHLQDMEAVYGKFFDPIKALDGLIRSAQILKDEIQKE